MKNKRLFILIIINILIISSFNIIIYRLNRNNINNSVLGIINNLQDKGYSDSEIVELLNKENNRYVDLTRYGIKKSETLINQRRFNKLLIIINIILFILLTIILVIYDYLEKNYLKKIISDLDKSIKNIDKLSIEDFDIEDEFLSAFSSRLYKLMIKLKTETSNLRTKERKLITNLEDISHEIKTPLTAINLIIDNLEDKSLSKYDKEELLNDLRFEIDIITELVLNLLKLAKLESGTSSFKNEEIVLKDIVNHAVKVLKPLISNYDKEIILDIKDETFKGDPFWEKEVYINLLKNAISYSIDKKILVTAMMTHTYLEVKITNKAKKIPDKVINKIFDRFYKNDSRDNNFGLGLNMTKMILEEDNAKINVKSDELFTSFIIKYYKSDVF